MSIYLNPKEARPTTVSDTSNPLPAHKLLNDVPDTAVEEQTEFQVELEELDGTVKAIEVEVNYLIDKLHMVVLPEPATKDVSENTKEPERSELLSILKGITDRANRQRLELYNLRSRIQL